MELTVEVTNVSTGESVAATLQPLPDDCVEKSPTDTADLLVAVQMAQMFGRHLRALPLTTNQKEALVRRFVLRGLNMFETFNEEDCRFLRMEGLLASVLFPDTKAVVA